VCCHVCCQVVTENLALVTNKDNPEAMLDGLVQCVVCTDLVGWRQEARKLVVIFTDQLYHVAGDGLVSRGRGLENETGSGVKLVEDLDAILE